MDNILYRCFALALVLVLVALVVSSLDVASSLSSVEVGAVLTVMSCFSSLCKCSWRVHVSLDMVLVVE